MEEQVGLKNIYKKSLAIQLIKMGHDLHHTMRNKKNPQYQVFVLEDSPQLRKDICSLTDREYMENK